MIIPSRLRALPALVAIAALLGGTAVAIYYHRLGLTLSHYDARGHLVVARRIFDSITPGWQQIGAVWLPLPHLLNAVPVQIDAFYRSGASAVALSIVSFAIATGALSWIVFCLTGSAVGAVVAGSVFALNPNVLYLQATPMTEPVLMAAALGAVALLMSISLSSSEAADSPRPSEQSVGCVLALACLTRYEAWPVVACGWVALLWSFLRSGERLRPALQRLVPIAVYPALAVSSFLILGRVATGEWATASGFFVPENRALGSPLLALTEIGWGARALTGWSTVAIAAAGLCVLAGRTLLDRRYARGAIALSLLAMIVVPWIAFAKGHPFRIRYMVPLIPVEAIGIGIAASLGRRTRPMVALIVLLAAAYEIRPLDASAPMVLEAQWDRPNVAVRRRLTGYLHSHYRNEKIMASMGSLGHYMQDASHAGFAIRDFLHEGNGDIWLAALDDPKPYAGWILIEEKAEGGDMLAVRARQHPAFLSGYELVGEGAGLALYHRQEPARAP